MQIKFSSELKEFVISSANLFNEAIAMLIEDNLEKIAEKTSSILIEMLESFLETQNEEIEEVTQIHKLCWT